jgi:hypothetical protein
MDQAVVVYSRNTNPVRWLAAMGIIFVKLILAAPHFILLNALGALAQWAAYIGYWVVAVTGSLPRGLQAFVTQWIRWYTRAFGWYCGIDDEYPPFESEPDDYRIDAEVPVNDSPHRGWAIAGIFLVKVIAAVPHLIVVAFLMLVSFLVSWLGFLAVVFTGRLPDGIQDFVAGSMQWSIRVTAWITGLTDGYPPFQLAAEPSGESA